ncbi:MAG: YkgJ family cysteine cluster protein [Syntrophorhabdaceae bacterium]
MEIPLCKSGLKRDSVFGYSCYRCLACCRFKTIHLNPYEIARLASNRCVSTTEFIALFTLNGGTVLRSKQDGTCVFLDAEGCAVHADRPLVCRLYPLGRHVDFLGVESFSQMEAEEGCRGTFPEAGTVKEYLEEQGAAPFLRAADLYLNLLWNLLEVIKEKQPEPSESETILDTVRTVIESAQGGHDLSWIDMDRALADYCIMSGLTVPESLEERMKMHIKAVSTWAE